MSAIVIRRAVPADVPALARLKRDTFRETFVDGGFAIPYPPDDLARFEADSYAEDRIAAEIADDARATWVAADGDALLAYAQVGPCKLPHPDADAADGELYQLYVRHAAQGLGLGARLLAIALDHLGAVRPGPVWIGVWSGNARAEALYRRRGFVKVGEYGFAVGAWRDREHILRRA